MLPTARIVQLVKGRPPNEEHTCTVAEIDL